MANNFKQLQAQAFTLAGAGSAIGDQTLVLSSMLSIDGVQITMTDIGTKGFFTLEPGNGVQEESGTFTGITQNVNGTATLTGVKHAMFEDPYTETAGLNKSHAGGSSLVLSNTSAFYQSFARLGEDGTVTDVWTFTSPNYPRIDTVTPGPIDPEEFATKDYVDGVAIAGAPKSTETVYGITKLSSAMVDPTKPIALNSEEVSATTGANKVVRANAAGFVSTGFISDGTSSGLEAGAGTGTQVKIKTAGGLTRDTNGLSINGVVFGGTGADGALAITTGTTTIDLGSAAYVEKNYTSISITGDGKLTFSNPHANGTIIILKSQGNVTVTSSTVPAIEASGMGGAGGATGNGSFGNSIVAISNPGRITTDTSVLILNGGTQYSPVSPSIIYRNLPLSCGGGGGAGNPSSTTGGGAGGGALMIECGGAFNGSSSVYAKGIAGADKAGSAGSNKSQGGGGGASITGSGAYGAHNGGSNAAANTAGGGGGGGGTIVILYRTLTSNTTTLVVTGGAGGTGFVAGGAGADGFKYIGLSTIN
jgi:hypothetical protein